MNIRIRQSIFLIISMVALSLTDSAFAQRVFMGNAYKQEEFVYEDRLLDDGTRFIMSSMWDIGEFAFSLCRFISKDGDSWYGLAIESKEYIPRNGLVVFVPATGGDNPVVLGQVQSDNATVSNRRSRISPSFIFGGGISSVGFTSYTEVVDKDVFFSIYEVPEENLATLIANGISDMRISSRSKYNNLKPWAAGKMAEWMAEAKGYVDARADKSVNCILEGLDSFQLSEMIY